MHPQPFTIAAIDQKLLLTFATLHLATDVQVEVPRIGQVLVRHASDRRPLVLSPLHLGVLKQFEGGRTVASVLKQLIHARNCVPLSDFYELIVKAHDHGLLREQAGPAPLPAPACDWRVALSGPVVRHVAITCMAAMVLALFLRPLEPPHPWFWWVLGWIGTALATSAGTALAASVLHEAEFEVRTPRFIRKSALPRFEVDLSDVEIAPPQVAINAALAQLAPPLAFATIAAWLIPDLALPLVGGLLFALAPVGRGPLLKLLRAMHHEPRLSVAHDFQFEANRTFSRKLRSWLAPEELRFAFLRLGYAVVWTLMVALVLCIATDTDARAWLHDFTELDMPARLGVVGLAFVGFSILAGATLLGFRLARNIRRRVGESLGARPSSGSEPSRPAPEAAEIFDFLTKTHPFELVPEQDRQALAAAFQVRPFIAGELLAPAGDRRRRLRILFSGRVGVHGGPFKKIGHELHPGSIFAERALLHDQPEPQDVRATARSLVLELEHEDFTRLVTPFIRDHVIEDSAAKVSLLRQIPLSRHWPQALMASFARRAVIQAFDRRTRVLEDGRENTLFFLVLEGELRAMKGDRPMGRLRRGDIFGEISLLQNSITQADIIGHQPGRFLCVSKPDFLSFLTQNTDIALQIEGIATRRLGHPVFSPPRNPLTHSRR